MEQLAKNIVWLPLETVQSIRYQWVEDPKRNYDAVIEQLREQNVAVCGRICRFKCSVIQGNLYPYPPFLPRSSHKNCYCGRSVEDYDFTYCYAHAKSGTMEYEHYHRFCRAPV